MSSSTDMLGRLRESASAFFQPVEFRVVKTTQELLAAAQLVYTEYLLRGYLRPNAIQTKLSIYQALPSTATFIASHRHAGIIGTITLVEDSPLGLPMDEAYKSELDGLRRQGIRVAEATMLALNSQLFGRRVFTMFHAKKLLLTLQLFKVMFDYLRSCTQADELVACFNPKHRILYDFLHLKPLGDLKTYSGANGNPAIARHLNVAETQQAATSAPPYRLFYGAQPSAAPFARKLRLTPDELRALFVARSPILQTASPTELAYLRQCYPHCDFEALLGTGTNYRLARTGN